MKRLLFMPLIVLIGCAGSPRKPTVCPDTSLGKLVLKIQDVPTAKWEGDYFRTTFRLKISDGDTIKVSYKGNLFINDYYIHLPWALKLELQKFWNRLDCLCPGHQRNVNEIDRTLQRLYKAIK